MINFEQSIRTAIADGKPSLSIHCWNEDFPGANELDSMCQEISIEEGLSINWESVGALNTGQKNILITLGK